MAVKFTADTKLGSIAKSSEASRKTVVLAQLRHAYVTCKAQR